MPSTSAAGVPALAAPSHERRMEAAPHGAIDDGFGGTITDVADFGRKFIDNTTTSENTFSRYQAYN